VVPAAAAEGLEPPTRIIAGIFSALGLIPTGPRPTRADTFSGVHLDYKLFLNLAGLAIFAVLMALTARRGVTDHVCGMKVDRGKAIHKDLAGEHYYFCSGHCLHAFEVDPARQAPTLQRAEVDEHVHAH
jgi:YHS domain-containing protein